jgi:hypothetical protein
MTTVTCRRRASPSRRWPAWKPHTRVTGTSCRTAPKYLRCSPKKETPPSRHSTRTRWASWSARGHPATGTTVWLSLPPMFVFLGVLTAYYLGDPPPLGSKSSWSSWTIMQSYVRLLYNNRFTYQSNLIGKCGYLFYFFNKLRLSRFKHLTLNSMLDYFISTTSPTSLN